MSDLYIMFDEAYDAPNITARINKLQEIMTRYKLSYDQVMEAYGDYIDSDEFYEERGI